ncbi:MAG: septum formation initiator family protein [Bacteroidetes bacterium]|nr:septum formation initiator family protein [Bacteroidota bacterium]
MAAFKSKLLLRISLVVVILGALAFLFLHENGILKYLELKSELNKIDSEITASEEKLKSLQAEIESLKNSKEKIERVAREKFNMMKKNEKAFRIDEN